MLEQLDLIAKILMSMGVIALTTWQVWGLTVTVRDMVKSVKENACRLNTLEKSILLEIRSLQQMGRKAGDDADRRFDGLERKMHHIYGLLNKTIPPND